MPICSRRLSELLPQLQAISLFAFHAFRRIFVIGQKTCRMREHCWQLMGGNILECIHPVPFLKIVSKKRSAGWERLIANYFWGGILTCCVPRYCDAKWGTGATFFRLF